MLWGIKIHFILQTIGWPPGGGGSTITWRTHKSWHNINKLNFQTKCLVSFFFAIISAHFLWFKINILGRLFYVIFDKDEPVVRYSVFTPVLWAFSATRTSPSLVSINKSIRWFLALLLVVRGPAESEKTFSSRINWIIFIKLLYLSVRSKNWPFEHQKHDKIRFFSDKVFCLACIFLTTHCATQSIPSTTPSPVNPEVANTITSLKKYKYIHYRVSQKNRAYRCFGQNVQIFFGTLKIKIQETNFF